LRRPFVKTDLNRQTWLIFLLNLALITDPKLSKLSKSAKLAFAAFCSVTTIPESIAPLITDNLDMIGRENPSAASNILSHSYQVTLSLFIKRAVERPPFFFCIANQFEAFSSLNEARLRLKEQMRQQKSDSDQQFVDTTLSYIGQLLALSLYFLAGDHPGYEHCAIRILSNLIVTASALRKTDDFLPLLIFFLSKVGSETT
jgi:hypothetical protein